MPIRILIYGLSIYLFFQIDALLMLFRGIVLGIALILHKGNFNRYAGIFIILINLFVGGLLVADAMV
ncbi:MAG: hypothetical protein C5B52_12270 [Bacteroidetes bacterium]|nr:MAG: hypothetical protein C5B52_12270 [Bacteroidota bacterium]